MAHESTPAHDRARIRMSVSAQWFPIQDHRAGGTICIYALGANRTIERLDKLADERRAPLGELSDLALDALERQEFQRAGYMLRGRWISRSTA